MLKPVEQIVKITTNIELQFMIRKDQRSFILLKFGDMAMKMVGKQGVRVK